ncbi:MAG: DUF4747 family protein [Candidatus Eremiobacteraeota bacterium]|nr:DUF4747 family protein [Candidatus Eremiobacteraeota bacterium]
MAKRPSVTVFVINIAIRDRLKRTPEDYFKLLKMMHDARTAVSTDRKETELFFGWLDEELEENGAFARGLIDRAIDVQNRQWYNEIRREPATDEEVSSIRIPDGLKANHREFTFLFDLNRHYMFVDNTSRGTRLSPSNAAKLFETLANIPRIRKMFGLITVSVVKSKSGLDQILDATFVKSLSMTIQQDNGDLVASELRDAVLEQMEQAKAQQAQLTFQAPSRSGLRITKEMRDVAELAADTGDVSAKIVIDGYTKERNLSKYPVEATEQYDPRNEERYDGMIRAVRSALKLVRRRKRR